MSAMLFREPNQVLWRGCRPGHNGTQVYASEIQNLTGWKIIYTVSTGKTLYMTFASLTHYTDIASLFQFVIYDSSPTHWRYLAWLVHPLGAVNAQWANSFWPPIELPAGYSIRAHQSAAANMVGVVHGWEE